MSREPQARQSWSRFGRLGFALALEFPYVGILVVLDAWIGIGFPVTAYVAFLAYAAVMLPWAMEGRFLWQKAGADTPDDEDALWLDDRPFIGSCSKCGEARQDEYTCRDGGHTVLEKACPKCAGIYWRGAIDGPYGICMGCGYEDGGDPPYA